MSVEIEIDPESGAGIATCLGVLSADDAREGAALLWQHPQWPGDASVWDFRAARFEMESDEIQNLAQFILGNQPESPPKKVAFVAPRDADFGLARIFEVYREDSQTQFRVFRDYDEAITWVKDID